MAQQNRTTLKTYFQTGDVPTEAQFIDLIDSQTNISEDGTPLTDASAFATAAQGALADTATQPGDLATVATSGLYSDLTALPTLGTAAATDATAYATAAQGALADTALQTVPAQEGTSILSTGETTGAKFLREDGDGTSSWQSIPGGGDALTASPLSQFAATTSAQLAGVITNETGSGSLVFGTSPTITTPTGIVKEDVGLGNVDNTSDATKNSATATLTNKRITMRVQSVTSSATVTPNADNDDCVKITAQAAALTLANPSGTATSMQPMTIRIKDNGTARAITYGANYRAIGITLPTTTVISKTIYLGMMYNSDDTKWDVVGYSLQA